MLSKNKKNPYETEIREVKLADCAPDDTRRVVAEAVRNNEDPQEIRKRLAMKVMANAHHSLQEPEYHLADNHD